MLAQFVAEIVEVVTVGNGTSEAVTAALMERLGPKFKSLLEAAELCDKAEALLGVAVAKTVLGQADVLVPYLPQMDHLNYLLESSRVTAGRPKPSVQ